MNQHDVEKEIPDSLEMENFGKEFYQAVGSEGLILFLSGELGAGKTTFVRGFLRAMHYDGIVKSPTYTLVEPYELGDEKVYHFDFYRLTSAEELEDMGIRDYFHMHAICLIEWPEKALEQLPTSDLTIRIEINANSRHVTIDANTDRGKDVLQKLKNY
jgi:tRNA threonylcarbamoyladenosine biosynthesis protein TsaE